MNELKTIHSRKLIALIIDKWNYLAREFEFARETSKRASFLRFEIILILPTVFTGLNAPGVYFKLGIVDPAFIWHPKLAWALYPWSNSFSSLIFTEINLFVKSAAYYTSNKYFRCFLRLHLGDPAFIRGPAFNWVNTVFIFFDVRIGHCTLLVVNATVVFLFFYCQLIQTGWDHYYSKPSWVSSASRVSLNHYQYSTILPTLSTP